MFDLGDDEEFYTREAYMYINDYVSVLDDNIIYRQMHSHANREHGNRVLSYIYEQNTLILDGALMDGAWQIETWRYGDLLDKDNEDDPVQILMDETTYSINAGSEILVSDNSSFEVQKVDLNTVLGVDYDDINATISIARIRELENKWNNNIEDYMSEVKTI